MTGAEAALLGALIGALGGLAGGGFAALAALRSSQTAARAPLAMRLHAVSQAIIRLSGARGREDETEKKRGFEIAWNDLATHQRILCPSRRVETLLYMIRRAVMEEGILLETGLTIAGQAMDKAARMVSAHSGHLFRWRAVMKESEILRKWVDSEEIKVIGQGFRDRLRALADDPAFLEQ